MNNVNGSCFGNLILMIYSVYLMNSLNSLYNKKKSFAFFEKTKLKKKKSHAKYPKTWCQVFAAAY